MRVYIDESGDDGFKFGVGSSEHLCFAAMIFPSVDIAEKTKVLVSEIRHALGFPQDREFHYHRESEGTRKVLLSFLLDCEFQYVAVMVNKQRLNEKDFAKWLSLRTQTVMLLGGLLADHLNNATLVFDDFGGRKAQTAIRTTVQRAVRVKNPVGIKRVTFNRSRSNDLLQLTDALVSCIARSLSGERWAVNDYEMLKEKELQSIQWPS